MYFSRTPTLLTALLFVGTAWHFEGVTCDQQPSAILSNEVGVTSSNNGANGNKPQISGFVSSPSPSAVPITSDEQYRATYFYPVPHHVNWNRDSYADAASEFGYNPPQNGGHQVAAASVGGPVYAPAYGGAESDADAYDDSGFGGGALGGLGGLGGIAGILGIKGIKGLGLLALAKAAVPILAVLLPALLLIPLLLLFFPVPVITVPATGARNLFFSGLGDLPGKMTHLARSVLESDKCVERISCEVSRVSRGSFLDKTLKRVLPRFEPHMPQALRRISRVYLEGGQAVGGGSACGKKYTCYLIDDSNGSSSNLTAKKAAQSVPSS